MFELTKSFKDYKFPHTLRQFKDLPLAIKYRFQRAFRGWADYDVLSMDTWFMEVIPQMLQYQRDCKASTPVLDIDASYEENRAKWDQILDKMIFLCQEMNEDTCSKKNEVTENYVHDIKNGHEVKLDDEMWWERQQEIDQYRQQCLESFFKYFTKYFHSLWI